MPSGWLDAPVQLGTNDRTFDCEGLTAAQCTYYKHHWHNWYIADLVYAVPTVAFFMSVVGIFAIGHISAQLFGYTRSRMSRIWQRPLAVLRYLSYRGFHVKSLGWNSAPLGILLLGAAGAIYFFCNRTNPRITTYTRLTSQAWTSFRSPTIGRHSASVAHHLWELDQAGWRWHACPSSCTFFPSPARKCSVLIM